ncbi:YqgQ family protein [Alteribacter populi]|uniref:YqgQ family protein n=1 Tax=Alteribacter populi TaxID=2011011 RepID=UPI000BBAA799|nr:YqgQ family protein [Alteribacter populi]
MKTYFEIQQLVKRFGTVIYTGDRFQDVEMMEEEVKELYQMGMIEKGVYLQAKTVLLNEKNKAKTN